MTRLEHILHFSVWSRQSTKWFTFFSTDIKHAGVISICWLNLLYALCLIHSTLEKKLVQTTVEQLKCSSRDVLFRNLTGRTCCSPWLRQIGVGQREEWNPNFITLSQHVESYKVKWGMKGHWRHGTHYPHTPGAHHTGLIAADRAALEWCRGPFTLRSPYQKFCMSSCHSCIPYRLLPTCQHSGMCYFDGDVYDCGYFASYIGLMHIR